MDAEKLSFRIDEAVKATGIGRSKLYEEMAAGRLPHRKIGARTLILRRDLEQFLESLQGA